MPLSPLVNLRPTPETGKRGRASRHSIALFFREWLSSPRAIGAVVPSSRRLARCIASTAGCRDSEVIVELGGGTGAITRALLESGVCPRRLIVIERAPALVALLRARFPQVRVIQGDATRLSELLHEAGPVGTIVSGLPLRSLPPRITATIVRQASDVLEPSGLFVQFTYWLSPRRKLSQRFAAVSSRLVWGNVPPARVWAFVNRRRAGDTLETAGEYRSAVG